MTNSSPLTVGPSVCFVLRLSEFRKSRTYSVLPCLQKWSLNISLGYWKLMDFKYFSLVWHRQQMGRREWFFYVSTTGCNYQGLGIPSCLYFNQYCLEQLSSDLAFLRVLYKLYLTLFTRRLKYPPFHDRALSRLKVHFSPLFARCPLTWGDLNKDFNILKAPIKVFSLSEFITWGSPRKQRNNENF